MLALSLGLHWAVLQTAGWAGMLASYSRQTSLTQALAWTFDGQHPCRVCHLVSAGRAAESAAQPLTVKPHKLDPVQLPACVTAVVPPTGEGHRVQFAPPPQSPGRGDGPPVPPPRVA
ncbi:MAG TPA: hypothetical protein PKE47_10970 [Verrucomicrobiota bacterium]|nr:hypothetical protein [Verrucomicrobiota bacterium]